MKVKFYKDKDEVFAVFPETINKAGFMECYALKSGHAPCSRSYLQGRHKATYKQYKPLLDSLVNDYGYKNLEVL